METFKLFALTCEVDVVHLRLLAAVAAEAAPSVRGLLRVPEVGRRLQERLDHLVVGGRV